MEEMDRMKPITLYNVNTKKGKENEECHLGVLSAAQRTLIQHDEA